MEREKTFKAIIQRNANNKDMSNFIEILSDLIQREKILFGRSRRDIEQSVHEHLEIIHAIRAGNAADAGKAMARHIRSVKTRMEKSFTFDS